MNPLEKYASKKTLGKRLAEALYGKKPEGLASSVLADLIAIPKATAGIGSMLGTFSKRKQFNVALEKARSMSAAYGKETAKTTKGKRVVSLDAFRKSKPPTKKQLEEAIANLKKAKSSLDEGSKKGQHYGYLSGLGIGAARTVYRGIKHRKDLARYKKRKRKVNIGLGAGAGAGLTGLIAAAKKD